MRRIDMKNIVITVNISLDNDGNLAGNTMVKQAGGPPRGGFNFPSTAKNNYWTDFTDKPIRNGESAKTKVIPFPSCKLLGG
jgi:hypothetical protein